MIPMVGPLWVMIFNEALSVNPRVSTIDVNFVLKGKPCIMNYDILQWVWKYLIFHIRWKINRLRFNTLFIRLVFSNLTSHSFKM